MFDEHDDTNFFSQAEWFARLSQSSRIRGERERADHQLLLAWAAYEGVEISSEATDGKATVAGPNIAAA